mmetsp:Transcript_13947/g.24932  ORF Transcript_13947/g.24932 Transcript_13947/m.24932 type:complete len:313 (+) Transcript_13947:607-1545(+)
MTICVNKKWANIPVMVVSTSQPTSLKTLARSRFPTAFTISDTIAIGVSAMIQLISLRSTSSSSLNIIRRDPGFCTVSPRLVMVLYRATPNTIANATIAAKSDVTKEPTIFWVTIFKKMPSYRVSESDFSMTDPVSVATKDPLISLSPNCVKVSIEESAVTSSVSISSVLMHSRLFSFWTRRPSNGQLREKTRLGSGLSSFVLYLLLKMRVNNRPKSAAKKVVSKYTKKVNLPTFPAWPRPSMSTVAMITLTNTRGSTTAFSIRIKRSPKRPIHNTAMDLALASASSLTSHWENPYPMSKPMIAAMTTNRLAY